VSRRFLVLHGLANRRPRGHWQWWLTEQLRQRSEQVLYPQFPDPEAPSLSRWLELLAAEYAQMGDGELVVVCHSLACALWYKASTAAVLDRPADRVLLVAPPGPSLLALPVTRDFSSGSWSAEALSSSSRTQIRLVGSEADPNCSEGPAAVIYGRALGLDAETIPGAGHLSMSDGYGPWPPALHWCLDGKVRFSDPGSSDLGERTDLPGSAVVEDDLSVVPR
jgi:predicted alpha/beta hydrolase family esterase